MKEKNLSIEFLKFVAVFLVANSHMGMLYGRFHYLATGGAIGDALFFFCSGFTLFLGRCDRFDNWYKRRINRIYPSIFAWALIASTFFNTHLDMKNIWLHGGGWFVSCIMIYYVILYLFRKYFFDRKIIPFAISTSAILVWYIFFLKNPHIYSAGNYFAWALYFLFMLIGAYIGSGKIKLKKHEAKTSILLCFTSLLAYYGFLALCDCISIVNLRLLSVIPLAGFITSLYSFGETKLMKKIMNGKIGCAIQAIASLCLEAYIVQFALFTDKMNKIFPANILIMFAIILVVAYITRCLGRIFTQIFNKNDFDWKAIFKLI